MVCLLLISLSLFAGCSKTGEQELTFNPELPFNPDLPYSVRISSQTENLPSEGTLIAEFSDFPEGCDVSRLVDGNAATKFVTNRSKFYLIWSGYSSAGVYYYSLTSAADSPECDPRSWILYGSNDAVYWLSLDEREEENFLERGEEIGFNIENTITYKYYKLEILANNEGACTQIAELKLVAPPVQKPDPLLPYTVAYDNRGRNMPSSGKITSQYGDFPDNSDIGKIVDGYAASKFITNHNEFYIQWEGDEASAVNHYYLQAAAGSERTNDPASWSLAGSNDEKSWTVVDTQTGMNFTGGEIKEFEFDNTTAYRYYRLDVTANKGGEFTQIAEWGLEEVPTTAEDIIKKYARYYTFSELTPMGSMYASKLRPTTQEDRDWLGNAANEPTSILEGKNFKLSYNRVKLYPYGEPAPCDDSQGSLGNCGLHAAFASLAYQAPNFIKHIITDNKDETFSVAMYDLEGKPITVRVNSKFISNPNGKLISARGKGDVATWATVMELALMKWNVRFKCFDKLTEGIGVEHVLPPFTGEGNSFAFSPGFLNKADMARMVRVCLNEGYFVVGGFRKGDLPLIGGKTITAHVYTAMQKNDKSYLFSMRNPHGGNRDGMVGIPNDNVIYPIIDFRLVYPGEAAKFGAGNSKPYTPPFL